MRLSSRRVVSLHDQPHTRLIEEKARADVERYAREYGYRITAPTSRVLTPDQVESEGLPELAEALRDMAASLVEAEARTIPD